MKTFLIIFFIIISLLVLAIIAGITYFFFYAFYRKDKPDPENLESKEKRFISGYSDEIKGGLEFFDTLSYEQVYIKSYDGVSLAAKYYPCDTDKTIILFHGYRGWARRDFASVVKLYRGLGFNILLVDQRANGLSDGKLITFGAKEKHDVLSWVNFVLEKYGKDTRLCLDGLSMGAAVVMMSAGLDLPENVKAIVADCGYTSPADIIAHVAKRNFNIPGKAAVAVMNIPCKLFGGFSLYKSNTLESLSKNDIPILFIHGKADDFVPWYMTELNYAANRGEKELCFVDGAGHALSYLTDKNKVESVLISFLKKHYDI